MVQQNLDLKNLYKPHPGQQRVHDVDAKIKVLEIGRRWGKSRFALWELIRRYVESLEIKVESHLIPPFHAWIVTPNFPQARQIWNEMIAFLPAEFISPAGIKQDSWLMHLKGSEKRTWGQVEVKSAHDPDSLQTAGLDFLWISEAQDISDKAFEKLLPTLRSPERLGYGIFEGIPALYPDHWFRRAFVAGERGERGFSSFKATSFENPLLNAEQKAEIESDKELLPERVWRRMYLAEFSDSAGYFTNIDANIAGDPMQGPVPGARYIAGLDLGRKLDPSVMVIMDAAERKMVHYHGWDDGTEWVAQREHVIRLVEEWGIEQICIDATGIGDVFMSELIEAGVPVSPYIFSQSSREHLLQQLVVALERQTISFFNEKRLLRQLRAFQYRKLPGGRYKAEAPPGEHDDAVFALALALEVADSSRPVTSSFRPIGNSRYVPTQAEANNGWNQGNLEGPKLMRLRRLEKIAKRAEELGIS